MLQSVIFSLRLAYSKCMCVYGKAWLNNTFKIWCSLYDLYVFLRFFSSQRDTVFQGSRAKAIYKHNRLKQIMPTQFIFKFRITQWLNSNKLLKYKLQTKSPKNGSNPCYPWLFQFKTMFNSYLMSSAIYWPHCVIALCVVITYSFDLGLGFHQTPV